VQAVIKEIGWEFDNADASSRAVLETARDEDAVQQWLAADIKHRAKGRYHASRESEVAEGNMPDVLVSAIGVLAEVAVEAKHGGKEWSTKGLEKSLRTQLAEAPRARRRCRHCPDWRDRRRAPPWGWPHAGAAAAWRRDRG
jgi:hypothetical protein